MHLPHHLFESSWLPSCVNLAPRSLFLHHRLFQLASLKFSVPIRWARQGKVIFTLEPVSAGLRLCKLTCQTDPEGSLHLLGWTSKAGQRWSAISDDRYCMEEWFAGRTRGHRLQQIWPLGIIKTVVTLGTNDCLLFKVSFKRAISLITFREEHRNLFINELIVLCLVISEPAILIILGIQRQHHLFASVLKKPLRDIAINRLLPLLHSFYVTLF